VLVRRFIVLQSMVRLHSFVVVKFYSFVCAISFML
jgi:hypothetical protein